MLQKVKVFLSETSLRQTAVDTLNQDDHWLVRAYFALKIENVQAHAISNSCVRRSCSIIDRERLLPLHISINSCAD